MSTRISRTHVDEYVFTTESFDGVEETYSKLIMLCKQYRMDSAYTLFAKPEKTSDGYVEWYTDLADQPIPFVKLLPEEQVKIQKIIIDKGEAFLKTANKIAKGASGRLIIENAIFFPDINTIYVVGGQPVITLWGHQKLDGTALSIVDFKAKRDKGQKSKKQIGKAYKNVKEDRRRKRLVFLWLFSLLLFFLIFMFFLIKPCQRYWPITCSVEQKAAMTEMLMPGKCGRAHEQFFETIEDVKQVELCLPSEVKPSAFLETDHNWIWICPPLSTNADEIQCQANKKEITKKKNIATEFDRRVESAGGMKGVMQFTLLWDNYNDLDLSVVCPNQERLDFQKRKNCNGVLDIDANAEMNSLPKELLGHTDKPVENIRWLDGVPYGEYRVYVKHFKYRSGKSATDYQLRIRVNDKEEIFEGIVDPGQEEHVVNIKVP